MRWLKPLLVLLAALLVVPTYATADSGKTILLATTTSTDNSGLLKVLLPAFTRDTGYAVKEVAVGTGKALRMGKDGDADVVLVHAPPAEMKYVDQGWYVNRRYVMYNDFVVVGPASDPAHINGMKDVAKAFAKIAQSKSTFVSRGDDSGTNKKELILWKDAGVKPSGSWYRAAGQGMGKVLQIAGELGAYTLTDRATWLAYQSKLPLKILVQGDKRLFNPYHVMATNPQKYPDIKYMGAMSFVAWITSPEAQKLIRDYKVKNQQLFTPTAVTR
ncbi:MAG: substrate-binding domain-containing protein [Gammaproteobacteria bacterium]